MPEEPDRVSFVRVTSGPEGTRATRFGPDERHDADDPSVVQRLVPEDADAPAEVITEWAPAPGRPVSYPAALPFLPDRECCTTEHPGQDHPPGARWPCPDPEPVLAALIEQSIAEGWVRGEDVADLPGAVPASMVRLHRGETMRMLISGCMEEGCIVQLLDMPTALAGWMKRHPRRRA